MFPTDLRGDPRPRVRQDRTRGPRAGRELKRPPGNQTRDSVRSELVEGGDDGDGCGNTAGENSHRGRGALPGGAAAAPAGRGGVSGVRDRLRHAGARRGRARSTAPGTAGLRSTGSRLGLPGCRDAAALSRHTRHVLQRLAGRTVRSGRRARRSGPVACQDHADRGRHCPRSGRDSTTGGGARSAQSSARAVPRMGLPARRRNTSSGSTRLCGRRLRST